MKKLTRYVIIGIVFVSIAGFLAHFVYEWSGRNPIAGLFFPVNESTWEHMKLCFFPMLLYSFYMYPRVKEEYPCVSSSIPAGILIGTFSIPVIFYTYTGILGQNFLALDIATFLISVLLGFRTVYKMAENCRWKRFAPLLWMAVIVILLCFWIFIFYPPTLGLFQHV